MQNLYIDRDCGRYVINPRSGESISIPAAIDRGFLEVEVVEKKILEPASPALPVDVADGKATEPGAGGHETDGLLVTGVYDPSTGRQLTLAEAIHSGSVDLQAGVYINPVTGKSCPLAEAIRHGYMSVQPVTDSANHENVITPSALSGDPQTSVDLNELLEASSLRTGKPPLPADINRSAYEQLRSGVDLQRRGIVDPCSGRTLSVAEALSCGLLTLDPLGIVSPEGASIPLGEAAAADQLDASLLRDMLTSLRPMSLERMVETGVVDAGSGLYRDLDTGQAVPIVDAISAGKLDPYTIFFTDPSSRCTVSLGTAIDNGTYDLASGTFTDASTGKTFGLADVMSDGVVCPALNANETATRVSVLKALGRHMDVSVDGIRDQRTGQDISLSAAVMAGILDVSSGRYVNPQSGEKLSLSEAVDAGLISLELAKQLVTAMDENSLAKSNVDLRTGEYVDPQSGQRMSLQEAIDRGYIDPAAVFLADSTSGQFTTLAALMENYNDSVNDEIANCRFDPTSAAFVNGQTGQTVNLADAIAGGFISAGLEPDQLSTNLTVLKALADDLDTSVPGIRDPRTGEELTLAQAIMAGVVDLSSGEFVNLETGERLPIADAVAGDQMSPEMGRQLLSAMNRNSLANSSVDLSTGRYVDQRTGESMSIDDAISSGLVEPAAVFMVDPVSGQPASLAALIDNGCFNPSTGKIRNPTTGVEMAVATAEKNGLPVGDFSVDRLIPPDKLSVRDLIDSGTDAAAEKVYCVCISLNE